MLDSLCQALSEHGGGLSADSLKDLAAALQRRIEVFDCVYLFGSAASGEAGPLSDLDVALLFAESVPPEARRESVNELAAQVEGPERRRVDLVILNDAPAALKHRVIRDGRPVFVGDEGRRVAFEQRAIREFLDFQPVLETYDRALLARARGGRLGA